MFQVYKMKFKYEVFQNSKGFKNEAEKTKRKEYFDTFDRGRKYLSRAF